MNLSDQFTTPSLQGMKERTIIFPNDLMENTVYICERAMSENNVIHRALFFTGFLNGPNGAPGGYSGFLNMTTSDPAFLKDCFYFKTIKPILDDKLNLLVGV